MGGGGQGADVTGGAAQPQIPRGPRDDVGGVGRKLTWALAIERIRYGSGTILGM